MNNYNHLPETGFVRLPVVLSVIPISKSSLYAGIKEGRYPAPVKLSERTSAWRVEDIRNWIEKHKGGVA
jgi:predicted DNA-binding transcriptional regulator AlpA